MKIQSWVRRVKIKDGYDVANLLTELMHENWRYQGFKVDRVGGNERHEFYLITGKRELPRDSLFTTKDEEQ